MKKICILGSTGSIGRNCLKVIETQAQEFQVRYLTAFQNIELLYDQAKQFHPRAVAIFDKARLPDFETKFKALGVDIYHGLDGLLEISRRDDFDIFVNALVGAVGLKPTLQAIRPNRRIAIANKETLVIGGQLVMAKVRLSGAELIPIDSEHSALLQCIAGEERGRIRRVFLTASGGPFRELPSAELPNVTVDQALNHPNWRMGPKITIDSATLMNKGLEVIEAHWLFDLKASAIKVVIHPQSIIHSMVEFADGSIKAQMGVPDMRIPIQYALTYPRRLPADFPRLDFETLKQLTFEPPDFRKFRCLQLCYDALEAGGGAPAVLNAANEVAVNLFLARKIRFDQIPEIVEETLAHCDHNRFREVEELLNFDRAAREYVWSKYN